MKAGIKRIEATLHNLGCDPSAALDKSGTTKQSFSFRINMGTPETTADTDTPSDQEQINLTENEFLQQDNSVQTFPAQESGDKIPSLPKFKTPSFTSHRNGANPALAMNLLQEIQATVDTWQRELQKILRQIQDIYLEGPIVNGWLESYERESEPGKTATIRHAEVDRLMDYVEEICAQNQVANESLRTGYSLCGLDAAGKVWSRPCPAEQVASVSMAIARYQKLRHLLGRKQYLETRLNQLAETLIILHGHIQSQ